MELRELLKTTPETLAQQQYDALRKAASSLLGKLAGHIDRGELGAAETMLFDSPAGDGHGCDNTCIDCSELLGDDGSGCTADIGGVVGKLAELQHIIQGAEARKGRKR